MKTLKPLFSSNSIQSNHNLISNKIVFVLVIVCCSGLVLSLGWDYLSTLQIPTLDFPALQLPSISYPNNDENNIKSYTELLALPLSYQEKAEIERLKPIVDGSDCSELQKLYKDNTGWIIRPYIKYLILEKNCMGKTHQFTDDEIISKYPNLTDLDQACKSGELNINDVSDAMRGMIKQQKLCGST